MSVQPLSDEELEVANEAYNAAIIKLTEQIYSDSAWLSANPESEGRSPHELAMSTCCYVMATCIYHATGRTAELEPMLGALDAANDMIKRLLTDLAEGRVEIRARPQ